MKHILIALCLLTGCAYAHTVRIPHNGFPGVIDFGFAGGFELAQIQASQICQRLTGSSRFMILENPISTEELYGACNCETNRVKFHFRFLCK